jgi:hypothetical protein
MDGYCSGTCKNRLNSVGGQRSAELRFGANPPHFKPADLEIGAPIQIRKPGDWPPVIFEPLVNLLVVDGRLA